MTVLYIDIEHDQVRCDPRLGPAHAARLETARARLEAVAGRPCRTLHFNEVSPARIGDLAPAAIVVSGCTTDWAEYDFAELEGVLATIREATVPLLGICGGHQLIGNAHGAAWGPLDVLQDGEDDPDPSFAPGWRKQRGFMPVEIDPACPLFHGLSSPAIFFQSHYWQLEETPPGFATRATSAWSAIQAIEQQGRLVYGVQFHPERYDADYPDGEIMLRTFFTIQAGGRGGV